MSKDIIGRYIAQVEIDFVLDGDDPRVVSFDVIEKCVKNGELDNALKDLILDELDVDNACVEINRLYADVWKRGESDD